MSTKKCTYRFTDNPITCDTDSGGGVPPSDDERCLDPAFYDANPDICAGFPQLVLKPETALTESGKTVQYKTYISAGGNENELSSGLTYSISNLDIALIEESDGLATGVGAGITTVSVAWQNLTAFAQLEVVASCALLQTSFVILIDNSKSMSQYFSGAYQTKLNFAKEMSFLFLELVNYSKDQVAVYSFKDVAVQQIPFNDSKADSKAAVSQITSGAGKTNFYEALKTAIDYLATTSGRKAIILFSDGEDNGEFDALPIAKAFKEAGGFIIGVATRSWGDYFARMLKISSGGYFLSAYGATQTTVAEKLPNLKAYMCSGDCAPEAGTAPTAQLNYNDFANWDVDGYVDLCGLGLWDLRPGNGLYVDMAGTDWSVGPFGLSKLTSKDQFSFETGKDYSFSISACGYAGNGSALKITIGEETYEFDTPSGPFDTFDFAFTAAGDFDANIVIEQTSRDGQNQGSLIDNILLTNDTDVVVMLQDDFDTENPTTIETTYSYYGCIDTPPGAQTADPSPPLPQVQE